MELDLEKIPPITGLHIHYYLLCKRKLWLYANKISLEEESEDVKLGRLIHEKFYPREGKNVLLGDIMVDILRTSENTIVVEIKKSSKALEPVKYQLYYYLYVIQKSGIRPIGLLKIPEEKKIIKIELTEDIKRQIEEIIKGIIDVLELDKPPLPKRINHCKNCAYKDFCFI